MVCDPAAILGQPSHGAVIRDAAATLIGESGIIRALRVAPTFQWQPEDEPGCGVYLIRETFTPEGDIGTAEPHFEIDAVIGVSILVRVDDPAQLAAMTDFYVDPIQNLLLRTPEFLALFKGYASITRSPSYPNNASVYMSETRFEFTVAYQRRYEPIVLDDYLKTVLRTRQFGSDPASPDLTTVIDLAKN